VEIKPHAKVDIGRNTKSVGTSCKVNDFSKHSMTSPSMTSCICCQVAFSIPSNCLSVTPV